MDVGIIIKDVHFTTTVYDKRVTSFVNYGWPYIPLEEGSHCALLSVGLLYILLALGLSLSFRFRAVVNIEVCFR